MSDIAVFGAYAAIPAALAFYLLRRRDVPFPLVGWLFVAFILSCGIGHLIEASLFYFPAYRLSGLVKAITAVVSWATVLVMVRLMPQALSFGRAKAEAARLRGDIATLTTQSESLEQTRAEMERRSTALTVRARRIRVAFDSIGAVAFQWEGESGRVLWYEGSDEVLEHAGVGLGAWKSLHQVLTPAGLARLHAETAAAEARGDIVDVVITADQSLAPSAVRVRAKFDPLVRGQAPTLTGILALVPLPSDRTEIVTRSPGGLAAGSPGAAGS